MREALEAVAARRFRSLDGVRARGASRLAGRNGVPMEQRRPLLLEALVKLYEKRAATAVVAKSGDAASQRPEREQRLQAVGWPHGN